MGIRADFAYPRAITRNTTDLLEFSGGKVISKHAVGTVTPQLIYTVPDSSVFMCTSVCMSGSNSHAGYTLFYVYFDENYDNKLLCAYLPSGAVGTEGIGNQTLTLPVFLPIFKNIWVIADANTTYDVYITGFEKFITPH